MNTSALRKAKKHSFVDVFRVRCNCRLVVVKVDGETSSSMGVRQSWRASIEMVQLVVDIGTREVRSGHERIWPKCGR